MRIGFNTKFNSILADLNRLSSQINLVQIKIASGKNFTRPSDDPSKVVLSINYKQGISNIKKYKRTIDEALAILKAQESTLGDIQDRIARVKVLAIQGANDTENAQTRQAIANEIDEIIKTILALANSQLGERYIFAGKKTKGYPPGEKPFELVKESLPDGQVIEKVIYNGSTEDLEIGYDKDMKIKVGRNGQVIFMDSGLFETLISLKRTLSANNEIDYIKEQYNIQEFIEKLDQIITIFRLREEK